MLAEDGMELLSGVACPAYAMKTPNGGGIAIVGVWFEFLPTVVEIELIDAESGVVLYADDLSTSDKVENYMGLSGIPPYDPTLAYAWHVEVDSARTPEVAAQLFTRLEGGMCIVRLVRTGGACKVLEAPIIFIR
ncbi:MAG: hypothetical protein HND58_04410 [Planctomycetota bacterium]|nr:MAG: hypothetical protein HND58_04410 [Planctomycetota bacterium]